MLANAGYAGLTLIISYVLWLTATLFVARVVFKSKSIKFYKSKVTPIFDATLRQLGFRYNLQYERWQIGCIGAPCFIYYNPPSSRTMPNTIKCTNFVSGNDEHLARLVHSIEEIRLVFNACGITEGMIEKARETWKA